MQSGYLYYPSIWLATTGSEDKTARLWDLDVNRLLKCACTTAGRNLTGDEWPHHVGDLPYRVTCPQFPPGAEGAQPNWAQQLLSLIQGAWGGDTEEVTDDPSCPSFPPGAGGIDDPAKAVNGQSV